jgi:hypothetical protein
MEASKHIELETEVVIINGLVWFLAQQGEFDDEFLTDEKYALLMKRAEPFLPEQPERTARLKVITQTLIDSFLSKTNE